MFAGAIGRRFSTGAWCQTETRIPEAENQPQAILRCRDIQGAHLTQLSVCLVVGWEDKFHRLLLRFERLSQLHYAFKTLAYTMINLRHSADTALFRDAERDGAVGLMISHAIRMIKYWF